MMKNEAFLKAELVRELNLIAQYLDVLGENDFKARAYRSGAEALARSDAVLSDVASGHARIRGVGESLRGAVEEFLKTGKLSQRDELAKKVPDSVMELLKVPGLGPKRAWILYRELKIASLQELERACREGRVAAVKGFRGAAQAKLLSKLEELATHAGKIRIDEAWVRAGEIGRALRNEMGEAAELTPVGALGRRAEILDRLEFFLTGPVEKVARGILSLDWEPQGLDETRDEIFGSEVAGFSGTLKNGLKLTLWVSEVDVPNQAIQWLCAPDDGVCRGLLESDPGRFEKWEPTWLEREWMTGRQPPPNVYRTRAHGHVKGIFHCHTADSDGRSSLEEIVDAAEKRGYEYVGISDHSQTASYAGGLSSARVAEQHARIQELQKKSKIRIFHGIESDILADGSLDYDRKILSSLDFVVASIHGRFDMDEDAMTARIVSALENPFTTIWAHPSGRLLLDRRPYRLRWADCFEAAARNNVVVEINSNPQRLDLDWRHGAEVEKRGLWVAVDPDAHDSRGIADTDFGETIAEKAMIPRDRIFNMLGVDEMEKYLWERKKKACR